MRDAFATASPELSFFMRPADSLCPLKVGDEPFIGGPDEAINPNMRFTFDIALYESEPIKPEAMLETIQHLADLVSNTVTAFKPRLA